jgi:hypothetical protein
MNWPTSTAFIIALIILFIEQSDCQKSNWKFKSKTIKDNAPSQQTQGLFSDSNQDFVNIVETRLNHLAKFIKQNTKVDQCESKGFIQVTGPAYGNATNLMISFTHGLWLAKRRGLTLLLPSYMNEVLVGYDTSTLHKYYCFTNQDEKTVVASKIVMKVLSEDLYLILNLFDKKETRSLLPPLDRLAVNEVSRHFLDVFSALWSQPSPQVKEAALFLIKNELRNSLNYTAVHKRSYHQQCAKIYEDYRNTGEDFDPSHIPLNYNGWKEEHALCAMKNKFIMETQALHHRENQPVYIASDRREPILDSEYRPDKYFSISNLKSDTFREILESEALMRQVDMFLAIHSEFFIANPYSSYSFQVEAVRICLELFSTPTMNKDIYFTDKGRYKEHVWISKRSLKKMYSKAQPSLT